LPSHQGDEFFDVLTCGLTMPGREVQQQVGMNYLGWLSCSLIAVTLTNPNASERHAEFAAKPFVEKVTKLCK
jgi:hypothetical protein